MKKRGKQSKNDMQKLVKESGELPAASGNPGPNRAGTQMSSTGPNANKLRLLCQLSDPDGLPGLPGLMQAVFAESTIAVLVADLEGNVTEFNELAERIFGNLQPDAISKLQILNQDKKTSFNEGLLPWISCAKDGKELSRTRLFVKRPGLANGISISMTCSILCGIDSKPLGVVVLVDNLDERAKIKEHLNLFCKQLEKQLESIESAKEELQRLANKLSGAQSGVRAAVSAGIVASEEGEAKDKSALVVDDIPVNQKLLIMHLKKMGFAVETALNGRDACTLAEQKDYDVIFMDCDMPVMNGYEATMSIRQGEMKTGKHVPIIAMTSYDREGDRERCLSVGMDEYLTKGATQKQLLEVVQWCLERGAHKPELVETGAPCSGNDGQLLNINDLLVTFGDFETEELLKLFVMSTATLTSCLQFAIEDCDVDSVRHFAYALKGSCASLGLERVARAAVELTRYSEEGRWQDAMETYKLLRELYEQVKEQIEQASRERKWTLT